MELFFENPFRLVCRVSRGGRTVAWRAWELHGNGIGVYDERGLVDFLMPERNVKEQLRREVELFVRKHGVAKKVVLPRLPTVWKDENIISVIRVMHLASIAHGGGPSPIGEVLEHLSSKGIEVNITGECTVRLKLDIETGDWRVTEIVFENTKARFKSLEELEEYVKSFLMNNNIGEERGVECPLCGAVVRRTRIASHFANHVRLVREIVKDYSQEEEK